MKRFVWIFAILFGLASLMALQFSAPAIVEAQSPTATPDENNSFGQLRQTDVVSLPSGIDFTPLSLPPLTGTNPLSISFGIDEINIIGQTTTTLFSFLDYYDIFPTMIIILLALWLLKWLTKFVVEPADKGDNIYLGRAADSYFEAQEARLRQTEMDERLMELLESNQSRRQNVRSIIRFFRRR